MIKIPDVPQEWMEAARAEHQRVLHTNEYWTSGHPSFMDNVRFILAAVAPLIAAAAAEREADKAQCCMCGKKGLSTAEDGGPEAELHDGRWVCSLACYDKVPAAAPGPGILDTPEGKAIFSDLLEVRPGHNLGGGLVAVSAADLEDLKTSVVAFGAPHAVIYARDHGLPDGHIFRTHYDALKLAGGRMDDFTPVDDAAATRARGGEA